MPVRTRIRTLIRIVQTTAMTDGVDEDGAVKSSLDALDRQLLELLIKRFDLVDQQLKGTTESSSAESSDAADIALTLQALGFADSSRDFSPSHSNSPANLTAGDNDRRQRLQGIFTEIIGQCRDSVSPLTVAYLGPEGTFTQAATFKYFGSSTDTRSFTDIDEVFRAVETGECQLGVVPVENSIEGTINRTLDRIIDSPLDICGEEVLRIEHNLLSKASSLQDLDCVYAHPQALAQCRQWLSANLPQAAQKAASSNAAAADIAAGDMRSAAIASLTAADIYGLQPLHKNIEDELSNTTRFIIIGKQQTVPSGQDVTSLVVSAPHKPGGLRKMLEPFEDAGISMTRIESRPAREALWSYVFFIDVAGHKDDTVMSVALSKLSAETRFLRVLGSYPTVRFG